jgi:hypothetical protein
MVVLLVKWAIAAIPAVLILYAVAMVLSFALDAVFGAGRHWWGSKTI